MDQQLALPDRREKGERGEDRLGGDAPCDRLRTAAGGELPHSSSNSAELGGDRRFGKRGERAECADAELAEPAMGIGIERQHGDGLGSEKLPLFSYWYNNRFARLGAARRDPSDEFPNSPTHADCGLRIVCWG